ncbi:MAG: hypothetical protein HYT87_14085 [Nitrospirae bacterium]|nr:hypothetical protein [Nitrospirota bacterium]
MRYRVAVIGASFAGVAAIRQLKEQVLVLDRAQPGAFQSSACGLPQSWVDYVGLGSSILFACPRFRCVMNGYEVPIDIEEPFCTINYKTFCEEGTRRPHVDFVQTKVTRIDGNTIRTEQGSFEADVILNASGWNAVGRDSPPALKGVGIETEIPDRTPDFQFHFDDAFIRNGYGYAWAFPCGETTRFGVIKYYGEHNLKEILGAWLEKKGLKMGKLHGGAVPAVPASPVVQGAVFYMGDSAGHCFPLTGEGIRPSMYFATFLGWMIQEWIEGRRSLDEVKRDYVGLVEAQTRRLRQVLWIQQVVNVFPKGMEILLRRGTRGKFFKYAAGKYLHCYRPPFDPAADLRAAILPLA